MADVTNGADAPSEDTIIADDIDPKSHRDSIEDALRAGFDEDEKVQSAKDEKPAAAAPSDDRKRGPDGKFIKADDDTVTPTTSKTAAPPVTQAAAQPVSPATPEVPAVSTPVGDPPTSWTKDAKAAWPTLPIAAQQAILKREQEMASGSTQYQAERERFKDIDAVMAPRRPILQQAGLSDAQALAQTWAWHDRLSHPDMATRYHHAGQFLQAYGININQPPPQGQVAPQIDLSGYITPVIAPLQSELQNLRQQFAQMTDERLRTDIDSFATAKDANGNLLYPYFEDARATMAELLEKGLVPDLATAYQKAVRWNDDIINKIQAEKAEAERKKAEEAEAKRQKEAQEQATKARRTAVSVRGGSPSAPVQQRKASKSIEDTLREQFAEAAGA